MRFRSEPQGDRAQSSQLICDECPGTKQPSIPISEADKEKRRTSSNKLQTRICLFVALATTACLAWVQVCRATGSDSFCTTASRHTHSPEDNMHTNMHVLASKDASVDLDCTIEQLNLDSDIALQGRTSPAILSGWRTPSASPWSRSDFLAAFGGFAQYIKGPDVQPLKTSAGDQCVASTSQLSRLIGSSSTTAAGGRLLFFTNNIENEPFLNALSAHYPSPKAVQHVDDFKVFSAMDAGGSHAFHAHGAAWIGAASGVKAWWLLPPDAPQPAKVNACEYLSGTAPPPGALSCVQRPGEVVYIPDKWQYATCALQDWTVGVGAQEGNVTKLDQGFFPLAKHKKNQPSWFADRAEFGKMLEECGVKLDAVGRAELSGWEFFHGDLNQYYNKLHRDEAAKRKPGDVETLAVHRWLGEEHSTAEHYVAVHDAIRKHHAGAASGALRVLDAGCGLGAGLVWFEGKEPQWSLVGHTISEDQWRFMATELPPHRFQAMLRSFDQPEGEFDAVFSIEAFVHSADWRTTIRAWATALKPGGVLAILDDFVAEGASKTEEEMVLFSKSWLANALATPSEVSEAAREIGGLELVQDRDIGQEYRVVALNYGNQAPEVDMDAHRSHQGWLGSKLRQRLTVHGKLSYRLLVFRKGEQRQS